MENSEIINVGIGFATGRKNFKKVLNSYMYHLDESEMLKDRKIRLHLFVSYDLNYKNTKLEDYTSINPSILERFESTNFIGDEDIARVTEELIDRKIVEAAEAHLCFGNGYAVRRNIILYYALKDKMDYILFMDDDEYPMAVTANDGSTLWSGQHVIESHINALKFADVTNGYHCGYISPIPSIEFDNILSEETFKTFIKALSNDVLNWDSIKSIMQNGGVTYSDKNVLINKKISLVEEVNGAKFITGGNLGLNLKDLTKIYPFYNPPGARGEDTFLSTCLAGSTVKLIPTYTFHDGFSIYNNLLQGVLPTKLKKINPLESLEIVNRFYKACLGWVRYKPLYMYITHREEYGEIIQDMRENLQKTLPQICAYFNMPEFNNILGELEKFNAQVENHFNEFERAKALWKVMTTNLIS
ncbi:MAG: hypothetical protein J6M02_01360 [Clostridia bacterium]|nr:hypothetical protein [Clostridia bacterium]